MKGTETSEICEKLKVFLKENGLTEWPLAYDASANEFSKPVLSVMELEDGTKSLIVGIGLECPCCTQNEEKHERN